jgi:oleate hydratase
MHVYEQITAGIGKKSAHIIGGGIGGLSAAAFLVDDAHMPANRITVYESLGVVDTP